MSEAHSLAYAKRFCKAGCLSRKQRMQPFLRYRMNGRGIESMSCYHDVVQLDSQITYALMSLSEQMRRPLEEQLCKAEQGKHVVKIYVKPITDENKELRRSVRLAKKKE